MLKSLGYTSRMSVTHDKKLLQRLDNNSASRALALARETLQIESDAILALKDRLGTTAESEFALAIHILLVKNNNYYL